MRTLINLCLLPFVVVCSSSSATIPRPVTTVDIAATSVNLSCIDWKPTGMCVWLTCGPFGCSISSSLRVKHFNPDAIVQVYDDPKDALWVESKPILTALNLQQKGGATSNAQATKKDRKSARKRISAKFISKEASVIGSPALLSINEIFGSIGPYCRSPVIPYSPYFVSGLDYFSWKFPYADLTKPSAFIPGLDEVGERIDGAYQKYILGPRFGNVYPRIGKLLSNNDYKASAVFAQRAADIVTDPSAMHVRNFLGNPYAHPGMGQWPQLKIEVWTSDYGKWQMLSPITDAKCHIFGDPITKVTSAGSGYGLRRSDIGAYSWQLWRPYECCKRRGKKLINVIGF